MSRLEARGLAVARGDSRLFRDLSFSVADGEWLAVRGANGSGKTTLLRCLAGLTRPEAGEVLWDGRPAREDAAGFRASMLFAGHAPGIKDEFSAEENLASALALRSVPADSASIGEALAAAGLAKRRHLPARRLSAGQRRRIGMARLALDPAKLWILDEPLTALDAEGEALFTGILGRHLARGGLAVIATHQGLATEGGREMRLGA
jgi:heme exporter protein A